MFKKMLFAACAAAMLAGLTACSSVDTAPNISGLKLTESDNAESLAHVHGKVWGVYFLQVLPLFTGNAAKPGRCALFKDTVTVENAVRMATKKAVQLDATRMVDLQTSSDNVFLLLFTVKEVQVSGNAVK